MKIRFKQVNNTYVYLNPSDIVALEITSVAIIAHCKTLYKSFSLHTQEEDKLFEILSISRGNE